MAATDAFSGRRIDPVQTVPQSERFQQGATASLVVASGRLSESETFRKATQHQHRLYSFSEGGPIAYNEESLQYTTLRLLVLASNFGAERLWKIKLNTATTYNLAFDVALTC